MKEAKKLFYNLIFYTGYCATEQKMKHGNRNMNQISKDRNRKLKMEIELRSSNRTTKQKHEL